MDLGPGAALATDIAQFWARFSSSLVFFIDSVSGISHSADSRASLLAVGVEAHASTPITSG